MKSSLEGILQGILKRLLLPPSSSGHRVMQSAVWNNIWKFSSTMSASENMPPLLKLQAQTPVVTALSSFIEKGQAFWTRTEGSQAVLKVMQNTFLATSSSALKKKALKNTFYPWHKIPEQTWIHHQSALNQKEGPDPLKTTLFWNKLVEKQSQGVEDTQKNCNRLLQFNTNNLNLLTREDDRSKGWMRAQSLPLSRQEGGQVGPPSFSCTAHIDYRRSGY